MSISNYGQKLTQHAIDTVGSAGSAAEFELGQQTFLIAGAIGILFFFAAGMAIINKVWR